jgi:hypothetical protein
MKQNEIVRLFMSRSVAFAATKFDKIISGNQPRQVAVKNQRFDSYLSPHHQGADKSTEPRISHIWAS